MRNFVFSLALSLSTPVYSFTDVQLNCENGKKEVRINRVQEIITINDDSYELLNVSPIVSCVKLKKNEYFFITHAPHPIYEGDTISVLIKDNTYSEESCLTIHPAQVVSQLPTKVWLKCDVESVSY